jgi:hypothetical protein
VIAGVTQEAAAADIGTATCLLNNNV